MRHENPLLSTEGTLHSGRELFVCFLHYGGRCQKWPQFASFYLHLFKCDFTALLTKTRSPLFHLMKFGWPCHLLLPVEYSRSDAVLIPNVSLQVLQAQNPVAAMWTARSSLLNGEKPTAKSTPTAWDQPSANIFRKGTVKTLGFEGHMWSLACILLWFSIWQCFKNINSTPRCLYLGSIQNQGPQISSSSFGRWPTYPGSRTV